MTNKDATIDVLSRIYHALRASRRRILIRLIAESDKETLSLRYCARHVSAIEEDVRHQNATGEPYRNVRVALSQTHLPTLSDAEIIIYDPDRQTVSAGPNLRFAVLIIAINREAYRTLQ